MLTEIPEVRYIRYMMSHKRFQHLLQLALNTFLNQMCGAFEKVVQHC